MSRKLLVLASFLAIVAGCRNAAQVSPPPTFSGPGTVAFGCLDTQVTRQSKNGPIVSGQHFVALDQCPTDADGNETDTRFHAVAFIIQQNTGEVAAVDLTDNVVLDASVIQPGFTLVKVGELPSGIAVPANNTNIVFVANLGTRSVQSLSGSDFSYQLDPSYRPAGTGQRPKPLPDGPTDLAYFDDGAGHQFLFAPLPHVHAIAQIPVNADGSLEDAVIIPVKVPDPVPAAVDPTGSAPEYERLCPTVQDPDAPANPPVNARVPTTTARDLPPFGPDPQTQPVRVRVVDGVMGGKELLVADEALPFIHRYALSATGAVDPSAPLAPLVTGVPISDFAVTAPVPPTFVADPSAQPAATDRYVYAIDATDDSVLVVDFTTGSPDFGAVLPVSVGDTVPDRIALPNPARNIEAITSNYVLDPTTGAPLGACDVNGTDPDPTRAQPIYMRGVFVAIATSEGAVRMIDVYDLDATCRGGAMCTDPRVAGDERVSIRRHRPRIGALLTRAPSLVGAPSVAFDTQSGTAQYDGMVAGLDALGLEPFTTCPGSDQPTNASARMLPVYPDLTVLASTPVPPLLCVLDDAHDGVPAAWTAIYEGVIPDTAGALGRLLDSDGTTSGTFFIASDARFCDRGVLGANPVSVSGSSLDPATDPEAGYEGDMVVLTASLPWSTETDPACAAFVTPTDKSKQRAFIGFPIVSATNTTLVVGAPITPDAPLTTFETIRHCFPDPVTYTVNTYAAFTVTGAGVRGPAFRHRVVPVPAAGGACRVDTARFPVDTSDPDSYRNSRARFGHSFIHPQVAFQLTDPNPGVPARDLPHDIVGRLSFTVSNEPTQLRVDGARLPEALVYGDEFRRLYVVDGQLNQMVAYSLRPLAATATLR